MGDDLREVGREGVARVDEAERLSCRRERPGGEELPRAGRGGVGPARGAHMGDAEGRHGSTLIRP